MIEKESYLHFYFTCALIISSFFLSCSNPELIVEENTIHNYGDTTSIHLIDDFESYITGKCIMLSFEKQIYTIPYTQLTVDTAYTDADVDWIFLAQHSTYVTVTITENQTAEYRNCLAFYRPIGSEKLDTVIISQGPKDIFFINNKSNTDEYILNYKRHDVLFDVFSNVEYYIEIPDTAQKWVKELTPNKTKSIFKDSHFGVTVLANDGNYRETYISLKSKKSNVYKRIRIAQDGKYFTLDRAVAQNPNLTIFYQALLCTGLKDTLENYYDYTYPEIAYEWTEQALRDGYPGIHYNETAYERGNNADRIAYPEKREFKYTMFVMPDTALANYSDNYWTGGIYNVNELRQYAEKVYPEGAGLPDSVRTSSLYKLISYHILPFWLSYEQLNTSQKEILQRHLFLEEHDMEDFYATLLPHSIMRISTSYPKGTWESQQGIYINRKGTISTGLITEGALIAQNASDYNVPDNITNICANGGYHYINKLLVYDEFTRHTALQCRMRIMCSTLSPDFINSNGRGRLNGDVGILNVDKMSMAYKSGYCINFLWDEDQTRFYVRSRDKNFATYNGDEITIRGTYDLAFKLPPVPSDGIYEIRVWNFSHIFSFSDRGIVQFYLHKENPDVDSNTLWRNWDWTPLGSPIDLRIVGDDARIGMILDNDSKYDYLTESQRQEAIYLNDKAMHKRGYMKAPDSYTRSLSINNSGDPLRLSTDCYRIIICEEFLKSDEYYWIRMRQVFDEGAEFPFSFIEIVPRSIYEENEDRH